jgi:hypothetical protein
MVALVVVQPETPEQVALVWGAQCILFAPGLTWLVLRELRRSPLWLLGKIAPGMVSTAAMAVVVMALENTLTLPPMGRVMAAVSGGGMVYVVVAWLALGGRMPQALRQMALVRSA